MVTTFDVVHDLAEPVDVLRAIRSALAPTGEYLMVEPKCAERLEERVGDPQRRLRYGFSMFHCLPQSLVGGGAGLGGLMGEAKARELATEAGFTSFTVLPVEDASRAFFHLTP